jgi:glutathione synthase/RimK-type ligase-like ATP-grasp enzyme
VILILTNAGDRLQPHAVTALERKGARYVRWNTETFPQSVGITFRYNDENVDVSSLRIDGKIVDLADIRTVWYRRPLPSIVSPEMTKENQEFAKAESRHVLTALWHCLSSRFWVNPYDAGRSAERKPFQLQIARAVGFEVPRTLITNDPELVRQFFDSCRTGMIYKSLDAYARKGKDAALGIFTTPVSREQLHAHCDQVKLAPCIFQEYVPKKCELRVTVMGKNIFTSEIESQSNESAKDDWRRPILVNHPKVSKSELPTPIAIMIQEMLRRMGLVFACMDFIVTPDGRYVFLELNPSGEWYWVEDKTGMPLLDSFTDMLIKGGC